MTLFSYGTLEFAEVMRAVTGRSFAHEPARLFGWERRRLRHEAYPGIRPRAGACTSGTLWRGVDARSGARLDAYETSLYERRTLPVRTACGEAVDAEVYVVRPEWHDRLSGPPWDKARFARESLREFVRALRSPSAPLSR